VIASAGTATAFYFASKTSEQAQQNLLNAAFGPVTISLPDVVGMSVKNTRTVAEALGLTVNSDPAGAADDDIVKTTTPPAGAPVKRHDVVTVIVVP
jgi:PASTA domain